MDLDMYTTIPNIKNRIFFWQKQCLKDTVIISITNKDLYICQRLYFLFIFVIFPIQTNKDISKRPQTFER